MEVVNTNSEERPVLFVGRARRNWKETLLTLVQWFHGAICLTYLWAGIVEFIDNPPFFDAYGDAISRNRIPKGLFENDPRVHSESLLRLMDLPIICMILGYATMCFWLKFRGLSWVLTGCVTLCVLCFLAINFWHYEYFDWKIYSKRLKGLYIQVSSFALCTTMTFMVLFVKRKRMPFKFKSSLPIKPLGRVHIAWNFCAILFITLLSMMMWFTKMYASWACFQDHREVMSLCGATSQIQCYPCSDCSLSALKTCVSDEKDSVFTCSVPPSRLVNKGAFCVFNYNMNGYMFLTTFAYIGGLCVFFSTFLRIVGHYFLRAVFLIYDGMLKIMNKTNKIKLRHLARLNTLHRRRASTREMQPSQDQVDGGSLNIDDYVVYDSEEEGEGWFNASCG